MRVLIVCTQNTCRSPMLESMLKHYLMERRISDMDVFSAGILGDNSPISEECEKVLKTHAIPFINRLSRRVDSECLKGVDVVLTMTDEHKSYIERNFSNLPKVISLSTINNGDILDPYGLGISEYEKLYDNFAKLLNRIVELLKY